ncbi:MAG: SRPBCC domain-containing protein [Gemmatimonadales bacterium]|nr:SRPBCC domain-containing protein [Gemmatimonadales bacterium]
MPDILHDLPIRAARAAVFEAIGTPAGLDRWWTLRASGWPAEGQVIVLDFGPGYEWQARVTRYVAEAEFELEVTRADADWVGTRVGFTLSHATGTTTLHFRHTGWREANAHYRITSYCWAMYLRLLARCVERGEVVPYELRLEA